MKHKMKTVRALKKRIKKTASGKYIHRHGGTSHNNGCKSRGCKRRLHTQTEVDETMTKRMKQLLPYT
ncbi:50S ribosomal protein L35 [candidate division WOR-3 bacterium JGI_Cruoil_03_51_56]|uniref:Large ribosomal subunit protein bL35 n=1 Tax=candidate division WOR-3 bacterium JGI_Cruoil_03_51_56 TaxID=1973747 RepID=A0A235BVG7_UNCW3|nr:MAG: 50S ribosomal protein L35 [candidate division WOR-3 bacterium JGI_Cruoil_03_51_56]